MRAPAIESSLAAASSSSANGAASNATRSDQLIQRRPEPWSVKFDGNGYSPPMAAKRGAVVVVPACNESSVLPRCLKAIRTAAAGVAVPVSVVVVLDACDDESVNFAGRFGSDVHFVEVDERNVGAARAAGFRYARSVLRSGGEPIWYATTDADTEVGSDWLLRQLGTDADMVLGVVRVGQWRHHGKKVADRYQARYAADAPRRHVHGANMGFRADAYWRVGGFAALASGEDVDLVERFRAAGCRVRWDDELSVATSDRRRGRAPGGFADHLAELSREVSRDDRGEVHDREVEAS
jgi:glycosyltransferase involved in cell wall biosynthesis